MSVLYYWRPDNYIRDRKFGFGYHLNQNSPVLTSLQAGNSVWAFTRDGLGRYILAAELVVNSLHRVRLLCLWPLLRQLGACQDRLLGLEHLVRPGGRFRIHQ